MSVYADLDPSPQELADLDEVLAEVDAGDGLPPGEDYGPWDDETGLDPQTGLPPELANVYDAELGRGDQLGAISAAIELANGQAQARHELSGQPLARKAEDRLAQLLDRAGSGFYTDLSNDDGTEPACGAGRDEFGRCRARFHSGECFETFRGEPIASSPETQDAWRSTLLANHQVAIELSNAQDALDAADAELGGPADQATYRQMRQILRLG